MAILFDSSIYVAILRRGRDSAVILQRWAQEPPFWLSSVALEELYAGADTSGFRVLEKLERDFDRARRLLVPNLTDWSRPANCSLGSRESMGMSA